MMILMDNNNNNNRNAVSNLHAVEAAMTVHLNRVSELQDYAACGTPGRVAYAAPRVAHHRAAFSRLVAVRDGSSN